MFGYKTYDKNVYWFDIKQQKIRPTQSSTYIKIKVVYSPHRTRNKGGVAAMEKEEN